MKSPVRVAIDGPAGAGKSTVAKLLAEKLGYQYVDTGAMYRAITLKALREGISPYDQEALASLASSVQVHLDGKKVYLDGRDVTDSIRTPEVNEAVSPVSAVSAVRRRLVELQRKMARDCCVVMDGRDIGTVVLPHADVKIYLTASVEERARRRRLELADRGYLLSQEEMVRKIQERDRLDTQREDSPLRVASDAIVVDTTELTVEEVVDRLADIVRRSTSRCCTE